MGEPASATRNRRSCLRPPAGARRTCSSNGRLPSTCLLAYLPTCRRPCGHRPPGTALAIGRTDQMPFARRALSRLLPATSAKSRSPVDTQVRTDPVPVDLTVLCLVVQVRRVPEDVVCLTDAL